MKNNKLYDLLLERKKFKEKSNMIFDNFLREFSECFEDALIEFRVDNSGVMYLFKIKPNTNIQLAYNTTENFCNVSHYSGNVLCENEHQLLDTLTDIFWEELQ